VIRARLKPRECGAGPTSTDKLRLRLMADARRGASICAPTHAARMITLLAFLMEHFV